MRRAKGKRGTGGPVNHLPRYGARVRTGGARCGLGTGPGEHGEASGRSVLGISWSALGGASPRVTRRSESIECRRGAPADHSARVSCCRSDQLGAAPVGARPGAARLGSGLYPAGLSVQRGSSPQGFAHSPVPRPRRAARITGSPCSD